MVLAGLSTRRADARELFELSDRDKPPIKILLYTDAPEFVTESPTGAFGLGRMKQHIEGHSPAFARFDVRYESRYPTNSPTATNKIDDILKRATRPEDQFDQIWFFGVHQINKAFPNLNLGGGTTESELTAGESTALKKWMDEHHGGVLVTGDHAGQRPDDAIAADPNPLFPDTARSEKFLGLGRALGRGIPRAGKLRRWDGDPTSLPGHTFNTQARRRGFGNNDPLLEGDFLPQEISHRLFDKNGLPTRDGGGVPHPLFFYSDDHPILFLPDHTHEGAVILPDLSESIWETNAAGFRPEPHVVATGIDANTGSELNLLVAYDGTAVNRGRIVADSSWHHYFNVNLQGLLHPAPLDSPADQIGQFYANLALWLCPIKKRQQMSDLMIEWLARHPMVLEEFGPISTDELAALVGTGQAALHVVKRVASLCEIHELIQMTFTRKRREQVETIHLPEDDSVLTVLPSKQLVLGYVVNRASQISNGNQPALAARREFIETTTAESLNVSELAFQRQEREVLQALNAEKLSFNIDLDSSEKVKSQPGLENLESSSPNESQPPR